MAKNRIQPIIPNTKLRSSISAPNSFPKIGHIIFTENGTTPHQKLFSLTLTWDDIANIPVANGYSLNEWNTFFQLNKDNSFESVNINGNIVTLKTFHKISLASNLFGNIENIYSLLSVIDEGCVLSIGDGCFQTLSNLTQVSFPSAVSAGINSFLECYNLTSVNLPSLITAGNYCFQSTSLTSVNLPSLVTAGDYCFSAYNLTSINLPKLQTAGTSCFEGFNGTSISLPSLITAGDYCFNTYNLTSINLPKLQTAGDECFGFFNGTSISLPSLITAGTYCFDSCPNLTSISLPSLITAGTYCFEGINLTSISLPLLVTAGNYCFRECYNLTSISLPSLVTAGYGCFEACDKLTSVDLPSLITADGGCFYVNNYLNTTYTYNLPKLQSIGDYGFATDDGGRVLVIYTPSLLRLGNTVGYNGVFYVYTDPIHPEDNSFTNVTITIPAALMTCNGGQPDGDIQYAQSRGICNVTTV